MENILKYIKEFNLKNWIVSVNNSLTEFLPPIIKKIESIGEKQVIEMPIFSDESVARLIYMIMMHRNNGKLRILDPNKINLPKKQEKKNASKSKTICNIY